MKRKKVQTLFDEQFPQEKIIVKDPLELLSSKVNWEQFRPILDTVFPVIDHSKGGRPSFD
ncbi:MAG: hypothetical protein LC117_09660 [Bacteroidia bacterium]|nr:hypothetical protein [Bacteroidia bacterium]MCZ2278180.1 hypothetical protein [Bacteroidia bacterium]